MPRASFTALIRSSTLTCSGSYFTTASWVSSETAASFTPLTAFSADCTVATQPPQVIPLMVRVTVSSFAGAVIANPRETRSAATTNPSKEIDLPAHKNHLLLGYWERIAGVILTPAVGGVWNNYESQKSCPYAFISTRCPTVGWSRLPQGAGAPGRRLRTAAACSLGLRQMILQW
jgi:hypothetical protein